MEALSPTVAMSASQKAKKVSIPDDPPLLAWITEVIETLNRPEGAVKLTRQHVTNVREHLAELGDIGGEVNPHVLADVVDILGNDVAMCRRLKPDAFSLFIEVLLVTRESDVRARGLYILAESLHKERLGATRKVAFQGRLYLIGQGCLQKLYDQFTEKSVPYNSRRWMGTLVLELIGESEDNQEIIALMSTSKKTKLGSCILYEASEILRSVTGRIITVMLAADHPIKEFFPSGTADKIFDKYPRPAQSASQWDKTFQEYVDDIWDDICADNEGGELQFAQNVVTEPPHASIQAVSAWQCPIYVELSDSVRVYIHHGKEDFDSAIDIPLTSIGGIATALTAVDGARQSRAVDVILTCAPSALCFVNSLRAPLSVLKLTVADQETANSIVDGLGRTFLHTAEEGNVKRQVAASSSARTDSLGSSQTKKSCGEEDLVLDGSYAVVHDSCVEDLVTPTNSLAKQDEQANIEEEVDDEEEAVILPSEQVPKIVMKRKAPNEAKALDVLAEKGKAAKITVLGAALKHTVEVDVVRDVDTGEVLTSKVINMGVVVSEEPEVGEQAAIKPSRIAIESSDQLAGNGPSSSSKPSQKETASIEDDLEPRGGLRPPHKKQPLKTKVPIRAPKTGEEDGAENNKTRKQAASFSKSETNNLLPSPKIAEVPTKSKLVAPTKKSTKITAKLQPANRVLGTTAEEGDIYDLSSSPSKVKKAVRGARKGKKAAPPAKSSRVSGRKTKDHKNPITDDVEERGKSAEPHRPLSKVSKEPSSKKPVQKAPLETVATTSRSKRTIARRPTKGKKNMKDLTDSEIDELVVEEASMEEQIGVLKSKGKERGSKAARDTQEPVLEIKAAELVNTSHKTTVASVVPGENVMRQAPAHQRPIDEEPNESYALVQEQINSSPVLLSKSQEAFQDASVSAIAKSDDLDKPIQPTAEIQMPGVTVEAKIGRRMAEIFKSASVDVQPNGKKNLDGIVSPQRPSPAGPKSNPPLATGAASPDVLVGSHVSGPLSVRSEEIQEAIDDDEFLVLSSPPKMIETEAAKAMPKVAELASAQGPVIVPGPDEEEFPALNPRRKSAEKHRLASPVADNPSKRQRIEEAVVLSSPSKVASAPQVKRGAVKAKTQTRKQVTPGPRSSPVLASEKDHRPPVGHLTLVDDHQARKTPLISFGPNGPRNQGLSSAAKGAGITKEEKKPNTLSGILETLSKQSAGQRSSPTKIPEKKISKEAKKEPRVPSFNDSLTRFSTAAVVNPLNEDDSGMAFFDAGQSIASSRSHSRVDVNGSPQPKRSSLAPVDNLSRVAKDLGFVATAAVGSPKPRRSKTASVEKSSNDAAGFDDDTTLFGSGFFISSNRKVRPAAPQDDLDFESRYTPHHSAEGGTYVGVAEQNVIDAAPQISDPFTNKVKRQDSDFARKLRMSLNKEAKRQAEFPRPPIGKGEHQVRIQHSMDTLPQPSRLRSLVDADATLVDIENRAPRRPRKSRGYESSSDSSDSEANTKHRRDEPITPTPQEVWKEALKPHQQDVSNVFHHVVDGLLQQLFDKEPPVQAIADEYRASGINIVEGLKSKMDTEVQALTVHATSTIETLVESLRQSRVALQASSGGSKELDDQYKTWRARQHALQSLPFMARESGSRRS